MRYAESGSGCCQRSCRVSVWCHKHVSGMLPHVFVDSSDWNIPRIVMRRGWQRLDRERGFDGSREAQEIMHAAHAPRSILRWRVRREQGSNMRLRCMSWTISNLKNIRRCKVEFADYKLS
jgi:hypothetical protein